MKYKPVFGGHRFWSIVTSGGGGGGLPLPLDPLLVLLRTCDSLIFNRFYVGEDIFHIKMEKNSPYQTFSVVLGKIFFSGNPTLLFL